MGSDLTARRIGGVPVAALALGIGLLLAPVIFQMFSRAPGGGRMLDDFAPYMTNEVIGGFSDDLALIDTAVTAVEPAAGGVASDVRTTYFDELATSWPGIYEDMGGMLTTMEGNLDNFGAVQSLPPFPLFPWFFVGPGVMIVAFAVWALRRPATRGPSIGLLAVGLGLLTAPAVFQMFSRAPQGAEMIEDFQTLMTTERVQTMQSYFLVIGSGEGNLRNDIVPALAASDVVPVVTQFSTEWPRISNEMAPMIGAMSDNIDNFNGVDALPPFDLFPWFFVAPGVVLIGLGVISLRRSSLVPISKGDI